MKLKLSYAAAAAAIAATAFFATPGAALALYGPTQTPTTPPAGPQTPAPGLLVAITTPAGIFAQGEPITALLSGEDANFARLAVVQAAYVANANIGTTTATSSGAANLSVVLPSTATGTYSLALTSPSRPQGYQVVLSADGTIVSGGASAGGSLPATGMDSASLLGLWVGGGALVLAGGAVAVGAAVQRQRKNADA